jgi:DNA-binding NarL/FixJ family response regulator
VATRLVGDAVCSARRHGATRYAYKTYGCRCPGACQANSEFNRAAHRRRRARLRRVRGRGKGCGMPQHRDVDYTAVHDDRITRLGVNERYLRTVEWTRRGHSALVIAEHLGLTERTVTRHRARARREGLLSQHINLR